MTVAENLLLDRFASDEVGGWVSARGLAERAAEVAEGLGLKLSRSALDDDVTQLSVSDRQLVALARALARSPRLLVLDEPTSALSATETERLFGIVRRCASTAWRSSTSPTGSARSTSWPTGSGCCATGRWRRTVARAFERRALVDAMLGEAAADIEAIERRTGGDAVVRLEGARVLPRRARRSTSSCAPAR